MRDAWLVPRGFRARTGSQGLEVDRDPGQRSQGRIRRILDSLHRDIRAGGRVRARRILEGPVAVYRLELERPDLACTRTTLLDANALETLLEELDDRTLGEAFRFA